MRTPAGPTSCCSAPRRRSPPRRWPRPTRPSPLPPPPPAPTHSARRFGGSTRVGCWGNVRLALAGGLFVVHWRHDSSERRRRSRSPADHKCVEELAGAVGDTNAGLAKEESVVAGGRRERNVGNVALSVDRHARACLPRGFMVKRAWAAATREQSGKEALARVRAALVPHVFRNIAQHRRLVGRIGWRPVLGVR